LESDNIPVKGIPRTDVDLLEEGAAEKLAHELKATDSLVVISANAPVKNSAMLRENVAMMEPLCAALEKSPVSHVIYISSDAVYADSDGPLTETSSAEPGSLHGAMHLTREIMLKDVVTCPLAILRPTLIYGIDDPHNGYGPNQYRRLAEKGENIVLFGEGEERRDHVLVDDVAELIKLALQRRSEGVLNIATGTVTSFKQVAEIIKGCCESDIEIVTTPRKGPMPHNGFRPFDASSTQIAFPEFEYTELTETLKRIQAMAN
jgi:nucleoside-diphosphate-sugar epimerase